MPHALIIEDDYPTAAIFKRTMEIAGYSTELIYDGAEAAEALLTAQPDVVLLDLNLPNVSGSTLLQQIRSDERLKSMHVILVTANAIQARYLDTDEDPNLYTLLKPISPEQLIRIARVLRGDVG